MTKEQILAEIRRLAALDGGVAPGQGRFHSETGSKASDWHGKYWARWGDAVKEAGLERNELNVAYPDDHLLSSLAQLAKELGRFPVAGEIKIKSREDKQFPSHNTFSRFGGKDALVRRLLEWSRVNRDEETVALCLPLTTRAEHSDSDSSESVAAGYVYLVRHGSRREYKIGRTNNPLRREGELRTELPEQLLPVHQIETDDPAGVEKYWHGRFADRRKNGEWFALDAEDVRAFKRWRKIF